MTLLYTFVIDRDGIFSMETPPPQPRTPLGELDVNVTAAAAATPTSLPRRKRSGPKSKSLEARGITKSVKPVSRIERTFSRKKRLDVLAFLTNHRIYDIDRSLRHRIRREDAVTDYPYRQPTIKEASSYFNIPPSTIQGWWRKKDSIKLYSIFLESRDEGKIITTSWFRRHSKRLFAELQPRTQQLFTFSKWLSTQRPEEYVKFINSFLRFIRRVSQPKALGIPINQLLTSTTPLSPTRRRFRKYVIINVDETPIPWEYLDGCTWDHKGAKSVSGKADRSGWNKRQATLVLYIFADGIARLKPKLIFKGSPTGRIFAVEGHLYSPDVTVEFNETAYNNEVLFQRWIEEELVPLAGQKDYLLVMDVASFHKTPAILDSLRENHITSCLIPPGLTSLLQPLDTAVNGPFKKWLQDATKEYVVGREAQGLIQWTVSDKRIMTTWVVAKAAKRLENNPDLVSKAFVQCGISVAPDGSQDNTIHIKDIPAEAIDLTGWEEQEDTWIKDEAEVDEIEDDELRTGLLCCTKKQLQEYLREAELPVSGPKDQLVARLEAFYRQQRRTRFVGHNC
ncbi:hypothetical protein S40288_10060 [Stachybotrys chartarum IBT 40288]|nr:hypothetical protein S40288_10060 [Stachybotrys chartarum IBT 40288]